MIRKRPDNVYEALVCDLEKAYLVGQEATIQLLLNCFLMSMSWLHHLPSVNELGSTHQPLAGPRKQVVKLASIDRSLVVT